MKKIVLIIVVILSYNASGQDVDFWITQRYEKSDLYNNRIQNISLFMDSTGMDLDSVFAIKPGNHSIVFFERYIYGESVDGGYAFVRQAVITKVDTNNIVQESFFVPFGWKEYPITPLILKSNTHFELKSGIKTSEMNFRHLDGYDYDESLNLLIRNEGKLMIPSNNTFEQY